MGAWLLLVPVAPQINEPMALPLFVLVLEIGSSTSMNTSRRAMERGDGRRPHRGTPTPTTSRMRWLPTVSKLPFTSRPVSEK
jgi:hypothetical protein